MPKPFRHAMIALAALVAGRADAAPPEPIRLANAHYALRFDAADGGLVGLERPGDPNRLEFLFDRAGHPDYDVDDTRWLGDVTLHHRRRSGEWKSVASWRTATTGLSDDVRRIEHDPDGQGVTIRYAGGSAKPGGLKDLAVTVRFRLAGEALRWEITVANLLDEPVELGSLGLPLPFNTVFKREEDAARTYTRYVLRHALVAGSNSHIYWMRPDGAGPYLLMTPADAGTALEYYDQDEPDARQEGLFTAYVHGLAQGRDVQPNGTWNQPLTERVLAAAGQPGASASYAFEFRWAKDYAGVRDRLVAAGLLDVETQPGMVVPSDLTGLASIRTLAPIEAVDAQYPGQTAIERLPSPAAGRTLYRFRFARLGENNIRIRWGGGRETRLEYFVTEPLRTLVEKRAAFIVANQQVRDPSKWYDGLFSLWDMEHQVLRTPDDTGGLDGYMVGGSDDPDLSKAPLLAEKNLRYPDDAQIAALEYYAEHFVWGKLQRTDRELPDPYGIYGVLNWKAQRESARNDLGLGRQKMWRSYDYPHLIQFYLRMYEIGRLYPGKLRYLTPEQYLDRAYGTARAYFTIPYSIVMDPATGFPGYNDWSQKLGTMHEAHIVGLIDALRTAGRTADADWLQGEWEKKVKYFVYDTSHPFGSEMHFDTTAFQSTYALARFGLTRGMAPDRRLWRDKNSGRWYSHPSVKRQDFAGFMHRALDADIAARGSTETNYYQLGSDFRGSGLRGYLTYMSQMGGWPILDYGLNFAETPHRYLRLGYASQLSAWSLMNTGDADTDYGYWYPGRRNDGAAGWAFLPKKFGVSVYGTNIMQKRGAWRYDGEIDNGFSEAIAVASTVVTRDPLFGLVAYGGTVREEGGAMLVTLHDEVQQRLHLRVGRPLDLTLERDGFDQGRPVVVRSDLRRIAFRIGNRDGGAHVTRVTAAGLAPGRYRVVLGGQARTVAVGRSARELGLDVPVAAGGAEVAIEKI